MLLSAIRYCRIGNYPLSPSGIISIPQPEMHMDEKSRQFPPEIRKPPIARMPVRRSRRVYNYAQVSKLLNLSRDNSSNKQKFRTALPRRSQEGQHGPITSFQALEDW